MFTVSLIHAQSGEGTLLSVGDKAPAISVEKWIRGTPATRFQTGEVHIVEFGATWCSPCVAAIPKLSALAQNYKDKVRVVSIFVMERMGDGNAAKVERFVDKHDKQIQYSVAVDDKNKSMENKWLRAAGKNGLPYVFVLDKDGYIAWIGSDTGKLDSVISIVLRSDYSISDIAKQSSDRESKIVQFDPQKLFLLEGNGGNEYDFAFRSVISKYNGKFKSPNLPYVSSWRRQTLPEYQDYRDRIQLIGVSLLELYYAAYGDTLSNQVYTRNNNFAYPDTVLKPHVKSSYGKWWHLPVLEVADSSPFKTVSRSIANKYNYSLKVPAGLGSARFLQEAMQRDLTTYFGYEVSVETQDMPYWKLIVADTIKSSRSLRSIEREGQFEMIPDDTVFNFHNAETRDIIWMLGTHFGYGTYDYGRLSKSMQGAFIDHTNIRHRIDFAYARKSTFDDFKYYLQAVGLDLRRAWKPMKVIVIRDYKKRD